MAEIRTVILCEDEDHDQQIGDSPETTFSMVQQTPGPSPLSTGSKRSTPEEQKEGKKMKATTYENPLDEIIEKKKIGKYMHVGAGVE